MFSGLDTHYTDPVQHDITGIIHLDSLDRDMSAVSSVQPCKSATTSRTMLRDAEVDVDPLRTR